MKKLCFALSILLLALCLCLTCCAEEVSASSVIMNDPDIGITHITCSTGMLYKGRETVFTVVPEKADSYRFEFCLYGIEHTDIFGDNEPAWSYPVFEENTTGVFRCTPDQSYGFYRLYVDITGTDGITHSIYEEFAGGDLPDAQDTVTLAEKVAEITAACRAMNYTDDYDIAYYMHDWLTGHADYDDTYRYYYPDGVLLHGTGVCQSYALAYQILMNAMGIPCLYVTGVAGGGDHSWNMIQLDGKWGHVDCTWDDPTDYDGNGGYENHEYFYISDAKMQDDHQWETANYPACPEQGYRLPPSRAPRVYVPARDFILEDVNGSMLYSSSLLSGTGTIMLYGSIEYPYVDTQYGYLCEIKDLMADRCVSAVLLLTNCYSTQSLRQYADEHPGFACYRILDDTCVDYYMTLFPDFGYYTPTVYLFDADNNLRSYFFGTGFDGQLQMIADAGSSDFSGLFDWTEKDGSLTITGCHTGIPTAVAIPSAINGKTVRALADGLFAGNTAVDFVSIPGTVTDIGSGTFTGSGLSTVRLAKNSITEVRFTQSNPLVNISYWGTESRQYQFQLPADTVIVSSEALAGTAAKTVRIRNSAAAIDSRAFADNAALQYVYIPSSVTSIAQDAFENTSAVIVCPADSYAYSYALQQGIPVVTEN